MITIIMNFIAELLCTETFWYISTLNLCVIGAIYVLISPFLKVQKNEKWDDLD